MHAGIPFMGYTAIGGLVVSFVGIYLWALEGPGGYHLHPEDDAAAATGNAAETTPSH
jgi:hypothetical protein